mmetsp:Transcript_51767/g.160597  ORF Transcript_51767/g.160597 Transcript_51767/m.160597 type:complete len:290 (+) Transcript_51767:934-1803(+)
MQTTTALQLRTCACRRTPTPRRSRPRRRRPRLESVAAAPSVGRRRRPRTPWQSWRGSGRSRMHSLAWMNQSRPHRSLRMAWQRRRRRKTDPYCLVGSSIGPKNTPVSTTGTRLPSRPPGSGPVCRASVARRGMRRFGKARAPRRAPRSSQPPSRQWLPGPVRRSHRSHLPPRRTRRRQGLPRGAPSSPRPHSGPPRLPGCSLAVDGVGTRRRAAAIVLSKARRWRCGPRPSPGWSSAQAMPRRALLRARGAGCPVRSPSGPRLSEGSRGQRSSGDPLSPFGMAERVRPH